MNLYHCPAGGMSHIFREKENEARRIGLGAEGYVRKFAKNSFTVLAQKLLLLLLLQKPAV